MAQASAASHKCGSALSALQRALLVLASLAMAGLISCLAYARVALGSDGCASLGGAKHSFAGLGRPAPPAQHPAHDVLSALVGWMEQKRAPDQIIATQYKGDKPGHGIARQMPLSPFSKAVEWRGQGDPNSPASFTYATAMVRRTSRS